MNFNRFRCIKNGYLLTLLLLVAAPHSIAQRVQIDSLNKLLVTGGDSLHVVVLNELSWIYKNISVDSATQFARKALALAEKTGHQKLIAEAYNSLGSARQAAGAYDSALYYLNLSIRSKVVGTDSSGLSNVLNNIGIIYDEKGDYDKALEAYFKGLRIAQQTGEVTVEAYILSNIGVVYKKQKQYTKVLEYYGTALDLYKKLHSSFGTTVTSGNIGSVLLQTGDYEKSLEYSRAAKKGYEELGYVRYVPYTLGNMAIAYDSLHQQETAESFYKEAYTKHLKFGNQYEAAYNGKNLVFFYIKHHRLGLAKDFADRAIALASKIGAKEMLRDSYRAMAQIQKELGQFREAYAYHLKFTALKDSLFEETKTKTVFELQVRYETEAKELKLSEQKVLLATNALELEQRNIQVLTLASASVVLLISGFMVYQYQRSKRRKLEQETAFQLKLSAAKLENELHQDRLRISRDLHDNIGSRLLFLYTAAENLADASPTQETEKAQQLSAFAKNTLHELRRTVWFINKEFVSLEELQLRLNEYFNFLVLSTSVQINLTLEADPSLLLRSPQAAAIFRVAQEAVSNGIKHSGATRLELTLSSSNDRILSLQISDDGKGFDASRLKESPGEGNGLKNMHVHAANAKGGLTISSGESGTTILLTVPIE